MNFSGPYLYNYRDFSSHFLGSRLILRQLLRDPIRLWSIQSITTVRLSFFHRLAAVTTNELPPFQRPSAHYSHRHCDNFSNFLRRRAFASEASTFLQCCGSGIRIRCLFDPGIRDPAEVFSGSRISNPYF